MSVQEVCQKCFILFFYGFKVLPYTCYNRYTVFEENDFYNEHILKYFFMLLFSEMIHVDVN